ncbi:glycoside hydrolase family 3 C-terminal domain-containing protein [Actinocatenispora sera]|uniref:Glycoside hydrolase family 3 C-terminal domain-containing protein n=1 Tax=Actinocatenispora sera TaxID=390989 RepID=A0A810L7L1_9ACTN|nr:glycoside hydrolase family 3 C-terminal domain-containing protein [Actinocatenispora sera]BCJ30078.1 hypothetical protein Asera_41860 [Actinocatenispora sera]
MAVAAARRADIAVVLVGDRQGEGSDRRSLALPGGQDRLVHAVAAAKRLPLTGSVAVAR